MTVPSIFWLTVLFSITILAICTIIGRFWARFLPFKLRGAALFYLSPALGLATLTIIGSTIGKIFPLGNTFLLPLMIAVFFLFSLLREPNIRTALAHSMVVSLFALLCGQSILTPLFAYGAFDPHNDAFTYLAHGWWLQKHAFNEFIPAEMVTPLTTQIAVYQQSGLRMGASYLLASLQALFDLKWSYYIYPAVLITPIAASLLATGFYLVRTLRPLNRNIRLALLVLPAFTLGGLAGSANFGFYPQTLGLALGSSFLFLIGRSLSNTYNNKHLNITATSDIIPSAILLSGAVLAYSELFPVLLFSYLASAIIVAIKTNFSVQRFYVVGATLLLFMLTLNTELLRAISALRVQSGAVVGMSVEWPLTGFLAHAYGIHGGASDVFQWSKLGSTHITVFVLCHFFLAILIVLTICGIKSWKKNAKREMLPVFVYLIIICIGIFYYRYLVPSPFQNGTGQSWNQFKLSDWASPCISAIFIGSIVSLCYKKLKLLSMLVLLISAMFYFMITVVSIKRIAPLINYYDGATNINNFYENFREKVFANCANDVPVYLDLTDKDIKFRQMAALYLYDKKVLSNWTDDVYISRLLPEDLRDADISRNYCVVERSSEDGWGVGASSVGPFSVGMIKRGKIIITSTTGAFSRESDNKNWWHWVQKEVSFNLQNVLVSNADTKTTIRLEYATLRNEPLSLHLTLRDGSIKHFILPSSGFPPKLFEISVNLPASKLVKLSITTNEPPIKLSENDPRMASFLIQNLSIKPESD